MTATAATTASPMQRDRWGNEVISGDANEDGSPYIIRSLWDGRLIRVCGEYRSGKHNIWWTFDEAEMRPVCSLCWGWQKR